ncbi:PAAR-like domain-containing protein [Mesorhizobium sp.]|uniref:PAAR-like domain-containing protein n=1 Tax=Mesorhizobium sp. TaxID=1871066 RepID=UPI0011FC1FDA|nr:PAAR-like domain-containing protein [Mesorhizobium sp.]TIN80347.1 MAG: DUF4150 domain-containing protein [Mesorhizobium sp.]
MTRNVFAGKWEIAAENGMNKSIARFPDVCLSPPSPPAGPIPIPYPDTSFSNNLKSASSTVKIGGKGAALAQKSYYKEPVLGDEAATRTFGANVVTHQITGKTYFQAWCMDVKFEGKNVCRHFDITTSNHASGGTTTAPLTSLEVLNIMTAQQMLNSGVCPCCEEDAHEWQQDPNTGRPFKLVPEEQFLNNRATALDDANPKKAAFVAAANNAVAKKAAARAAAKTNPSSACNNLHPDRTDPCALYCDIPTGTRYPGGKTPAQKCKGNFKENKRNATLEYWDKKLGRRVPRQELDPNSKVAGTMRPTQINHMTPKLGAGCNSPMNTVPNNEMGGSHCEDLEKAQSEVEKTLSAIEQNLKHAAAKASGS